MRAQILTRLSELESLEDEWQALYERSAEASPFQSPDWLLPWVRQFASQAALRVVALRNQSRLVGLLPLLDQGQPVCTGLIGAGITDYLDALVDDRASEAPSELWRALDDVAREVDRVELRDVPASSYLLRSDALPANVVRKPAAVCPRIALPSRYTEYEALLPHWLRRNLRQGEARLSRLGEIRWQRASSEDAPEILEALFDLHSREWSARGSTGVLADAGVRAFHREAAPRLIRASKLALFALRLDERIVGVLHALWGPRAYQYASGMDPELDRCSIGSLLIAHAVCDAIQSGTCEYDFLRGREPYKYAWGGRNHHTFAVTLRRTGRQAAPGSFN